MFRETSIFGDYSQLLLLLLYYCVGSCKSIDEGGVVKTQHSISPKLTLFFHGVTDFFFLIYTNLVINHGFSQNSWELQVEVSPFYSYRLWPIFHLCNGFQDEGGSFSLPYFFCKQYKTTSSCT